LPQFIDLYALEKAIARVDEGLARHLSAPGDLQLQDGLMLRLASAYELIEYAINQGLTPTTNQDWLVFHEMYRNTKQSYNDAAAAEALKVIPHFLREAHALLSLLSSPVKT